MTKLDRKTEVRIEKHTVGNNHPPFIIAEMSGNHNQSLERAKEIVLAAAKSGAHAIKLQTYTADTLTIDHRGGLFDITDESSPWHGKNLYELYQEASTPWEWHEPLFDYARSLGLICFSTPFDETAVDFLENLNVPCYKIASFENNDVMLLRKVARTKKPVIISSGATNISDMMESVKVLRENGSGQVILLKCTSTYPASPLNTNLVTLPILQHLFPDCILGLSDHTMGIGTAVASVALGARVIEKHFTLNRGEGGVDSVFSLEPSEFKALVVESERAYQSLGDIQLAVQDAEITSTRFKRSIYVVKDMEAGETFSPDNIRIIRPGDGLAPKHFESLLGKRAKVALSRGTPLKSDDVL